MRQFTRRASGGLWTNLCLRAGGVPLLLLWLALGALGCSVPEPKQAPDTGAYFPLVEGAHWRYAFSTAAGSLEMEVVGRGDRELPGGQRHGFVMEERNLGPSLGFDEVAPVAYIWEDGYLAQIKALGYDSQGKLRSLGQSDATWILPVDPRPGQSWDQQHSLFDTPEGGGALLGWSTDIRGVTRVTVPAGSFDALEVVSSYFEGPERTALPQVIYTDYYARGVGLVKSITDDPSGDVSHRIEQVLLAYEIPTP